MCAHNRKRAGKLSAILFAAAAASSARAAIPVFVDHFNNGSVANSDTVPNFWNTVIDAAGTAVEGNGGSLTLTATGASGGDQYPFTQISSPLQNSFNFFRSPIVLQASGLGYAPGSAAVGLTQFNLTTEALFNGGSRTEYEAEDAFTIWVANQGNANGQLLMGIKEDAKNHSSAFDGYPLIGRIGHHAGTQNYAGQIRSFKIVLSPKFYDLTVVHDTSPTDATPVTEHFANGLDIFRTGVLAWATATNPQGDSALNIETQLGGTSNGADAASFSVGQVSVSQFNTPYLGPSEGNWSDGNNWSDADIQHPNGDFTNSNVPNFIGANVTFAATGSPKTVITDHDQTIGQMSFDSTGPYTVTVSGNGEGTIHLATRYLFNEVNVLSGSHTVFSPLFMHNDTVFSVNQASSTLTAPTIIAENPAAINLTKTGPGALITTNAICNILSVNGGTLTMLNGGTTSSVSNVKALNIAGATDAWTAALDLTNNAAIIDYAPGASTLATVANQIKSGRGTGAWTGTGIRSSAAASVAADSANQHKTALGFAEASALGITSFQGQNFDDSAILIRYTFSGDSNLDGTVNSNDFTALATHFNQTGKSWFDGDFNLDGTVNALDFNAIASNFGQALSFSPALGSLVPEPSLAMIWIGLGIFGCRYRRHRSSAGA